MIQICKSVLIEFGQSKLQKVNKHPKFDYNFDIRRQLEHFEYEMNRTLVQQFEKYVKIIFFV